MQPSSLKPSSLAKLPARFIAVSFLVVIATGTFLLMMPFSSKDGQFTSLIDALFTATSATCVTGLVVFDTFSKWTVTGQVIILALIQIGGLGLVTITSFFNVMLGRKLGLRSRQLASESVSANSIADVTKLVKWVIVTAFSFELVGAVLLATTFIPQYGSEGIFISVFLAVSAFCNAGFDILGRQSPYISLCNYTDNFVVIAVVALLIIAGGLGFMVWHDIFNYRHTKKLELHTKIVLIVSGILITVGFFMFLGFEWNNPKTMGELPLFEKLGAAMFQSVTVRTAGFNSVDFAGMHDITKILSSVLMFIGAAPGSTGGGIKITTLAVIFMTVVCITRGREDTIILRRKVSKNTVYKALAITMIALIGVMTSAGLITAFLQSAYPITGVDSLFETISAFATVGVSVGVTGQADLPSKIILILLMFVGRVGPVSFALSLAMRGTGNKNEIIPEGKIMVG